MHQDCATARRPAGRPEMADESDRRAGSVSDRSSSGSRRTPVAHAPGSPSQSDYLIRTRGDGPAHPGRSQRRRLVVEPDPPPFGADAGRSFSDWLISAFIRCCGSLGYWLKTQPALPRGRTAKPARMKQPPHDRPPCRLYPARNGQSPCPVAVAKPHARRRRTPAGRPPRSAVPTGNLRITGKSRRVARIRATRTWKEMGDRWKISRANRTP